jgi:predicted metalloprotease with PDZ domain
MHFSRREFTKRLSWLLASLPVGASLASAQYPESPGSGISVIQTPAGIARVPTSVSPSPSSVSYRVRVLPEPHELGIEMTVEGPAAEGLVRLESPTWVPGAYVFLPLARDLFDLKAQDARTGASLDVSREGWQAFHVEGGRGAIRVSYRAYAYATQYGAVSGLLDSEYAVLLGTRFLRVPAWPGPCRVAYDVPAHWKVHHPSGASRLGETTAWDYPSYEILLDSPVVMGSFELIKRKVKGTNFYFVFVDRGLGYESQVNSFVDSLGAAAEQYHEIFGSFPFEYYTFVLSLNPAAEWGLEHLTSTMCGLGPEVFIDSEQNANATRLCAHELFHAWNVRRLRPAPLKQLDLYNGSFTEGLWVGEGFTRYYEFLICTRTRVYTPEQFFSAVVNYYRHLAAVPAYQRVTPVDSSLAAYLNHSKYPGRCNNSIDYYDAGMLVAFDLDCELRMKTPADSLDSAFSAFYEKYVNSHLGYTTTDVIEFFDARHPGLGEMVAREVTRPSGLVVESQLKRLGFAVEMKSVRYLGLMFNNATGPAIYNVLDTSPAGQAGLAPDDVLTRVNGFPFSMKALTWVAWRADPVTLEVLRGQRTLTFTVMPREQVEIGSLAWAGSEEQARLIRTWLQRDDFRPTRGQKFDLKFYENIHGIETVV